MFPSTVLMENSPARDVVYNPRWWGVANTMGLQERVMTRRVQGHLGEISYIDVHGGESHGVQV